jgi:hypothetical protein
MRLSDSALRPEQKEPREFRHPRDLTPRQAQLCDGEDYRVPRQAGDRADRSEPVEPIARGGRLIGTSFRGGSPWRRPVRRWARMPHWHSD